MPPSAILVASSSPASASSSFPPELNPNSLVISAANYVALSAPPTSIPIGFAICICSSMDTKMRFSFVPVSLIVCIKISSWNLTELNCSPFASPSKVELSNSPFAPPLKKWGSSHSHPLLFPVYKHAPHSKDHSLPSILRVFDKLVQLEKDYPSTDKYPLRHLELSTDEDYPLMDIYLLMR